MNYGGGEHPVCPMLGFPDEQLCRLNRYPFYVCRPVQDQPDLVAAVWWDSGDQHFKVGLFILHPNTDLDGETVLAKEVLEPQLAADGPLHAQSLIFHLVQTHLPREVTSNAA
jgi:hypothetical protein